MKISLGLPPSLANRDLVQATEIELPVEVFLGETTKMPFKFRFIFTYIVMCYLDWIV